MATIKGLNSVVKKLSGTIGPDILSKIASIKNPPHLNVGFFENDQYPDGTYVAQVAYWNEFGTRTALPRPFMRDTISSKSGEWVGTFAGALKYTNGDIRKAMEIMGIHISGQVKETITEMQVPENSEVTNLLKQRFPTGGYTADDFFSAARDVAKGKTAPPGKPLVWSGKLLQSVSYEVSDD